MWLLNLIKTIFIKKEIGVKDMEFNDVIDKVLEHEGGYVNDPNDLGGETKYGISKRAYPDVDIFNFDENISCSFKSKVRQHGDLKNHIKMIKGNIISSLDVKLLEGNINGVTNFKLYLPESRNHSNEVFITTLLDEMGFLAPNTFFVNSSVNKKKIR